MVIADSPDKAEDKFEDMTFAEKPKELGKSMTTPEQAYEDSTKKGTMFASIKSPGDGADIPIKSKPSGLCVSMCSPNEGNDGGSGGPKLLTPFAKRNSAMISRTSSGAPQMARCCDFCKGPVKCWRSNMLDYL